MQPERRRPEIVLHRAAGAAPHGAPLEATLSSSATPLAVALGALVEQSEWTPNEYSIEIAQTLLKAGARLASVTLTLAAALCLGRMDDAMRLAPSAGVKDRQIALEAAAMNGKVPAIAMLIELGVDVNAHNTKVQYHATPLTTRCPRAPWKRSKYSSKPAPKSAQRMPPTKPRRSWAEYFLREEKNKKQYAEIVAYLREKGQEG